MKIRLPDFIEPLFYVRVAFSLLSGKGHFFHPRLRALRTRESARSLPLASELRIWYVPVIMLA